MSCVCVLLPIHIKVHIQTVQIFKFFPKTVFSSYGVCDYHEYEDSINILKRKRKATVLNPLFFHMDHMRIIS